MLPVQLSSSAPHRSPWQRDRLSRHLMEEVTGGAVPSSGPAPSPPVDSDLADSKISLLTIPQLVSVSPFTSSLHRKQNPNFGGRG